MSLLRAALLLFGGATLLVAGFVAESEYQLREAMRALRAAGYGELALRGAGHYCPLGEATFAFIAQGGARGRRDGLENEGYVCTGYFGGASVHETKVDPADEAYWPG